MKDWDHSCGAYLNIGADFASNAESRLRYGPCAMRIVHIRGRGAADCLPVNRGVLPTIHQLRDSAAVDPELGSIVGKMLLECHL